MSTTAVTAAAASFRKEQSACTHGRMRVRVRGRGRNTVWALLGSGVFSNKEHILQTARELFLLCAFTSPQAGNFFVGMFLRLIIYSMQGLNLQILIWQNSCSLRGVLCMVHPVEGREGWAHPGCEGLQTLLTSVTTELLSVMVDFTGVWSCGGDTTLGQSGQKVWFGGDFFAIILRQLA